jgi:hypothetical protein
MITIPNLIPNLSMAEGNQERNLMSRINDSAANGKYGVHVTGALDSPDISGIGAVAVQIGQDLLASIPSQLIGNVLDAPESVVQLGQNVVSGLSNPESIKNAPENLVRGLGGMFGIGGNQQQEQQQQPAPNGGGQQEPQQQPQQQNRQQQQQQLLRGLGNLLGGNR